MSGGPTASYEAVVSQLHTTYGAIVAGLAQELAETRAALHTAHTELSTARTVERNGHS